MARVIGVIIFARNNPNCSQKNPGYLSIRGNLFVTKTNKILIIKKIKKNLLMKKKKYIPKIIDKNANV